MTCNKSFKLSASFFQAKDVLSISQQLIGKVLVTKINNVLASGMIVETEAYRGPNDRASHAYNNRRTSRTETMYLPGGVAYVYLCYGLHHLFNVVTNQENVPHAVLIRAIEPLEGVKTMLSRRNLVKIEKRLCSGPGNLTQALGITTALDATCLSGPTIWIENRQIPIAPHQIETSPRIGVAYAKEDALLPWRFTLKDNSWISS